MAYLCSERTPIVQIKYFMFDRWTYRLFVLNTGWKRDHLQIMIFVNVRSTQRIWIQNAFWDVKTRNDAKGVNFFLPSYLTTLLAYLCSQWTPNVQINYFVFDKSINRIFVLNWDCKRDSLKMIIFVYVC
jgi:hypothetical protein